MKTAMLTFVVATQLLVHQASAGVNGIYRVTGSEIDHGQRYSFTGTVKVTSLRSGAYNLRFSDGDKATYTFQFSKKLKETPSAQTVTATNRLGTTIATFQTRNGKATVKFSYKSKDGSVKGQGSGSK